MSTRTYDPTESKDTIGIWDVQRSRGLRVQPSLSLNAGLPPTVGRGRAHTPAPPPAGGRRGGARNVLASIARRCRCIQDLSHN